MSDNEAVIVTGCNGGIGSAICQKFKQEGIVTIGLDLHAESRTDLDYFFSVDLHQAVTNPAYGKKTLDKMVEVTDKLSLTGVINNAAVQILGSLSSTTLEQFRTTLDVNVSAPFLLAKTFEAQLAQNSGCLLNIGSIHAGQTKPGFVAYATSKGGLRALTSALAVDIGSRIRVIAIEPAAIATRMLTDGFRNKPNDLSVLESYHPSQCIGKPEEVAEVAYQLVVLRIPFLNGSVIRMDGAISQRLHDPG